MGTKYHYWICLCDCDKNQQDRKEKLVSHQCLRDGKTRSCGCISKENPSQKTHGMSKTPEFNTWWCMIERCTNIKHKSYKDYGGRGIKVCDRWLKCFENFYEDMGNKPSKKHSIDRYPNNDGNYEPGNVRWATCKQQSDNKRNSLYFEYDNEILHIDECMKKFNLTREIIHNRMKLGWKTEKILTTPIILYGGYIENLFYCPTHVHIGDILGNIKTFSTYLHKTNTYDMFSLVKRKAEDYHHIKLLKPTWTLVWTGRRKESWGYLVNQEHVDFETYRKNKNERKYD
jgi:hypothetical protein